jgi:hypothetical protein
VAEEEYESLLRDLIAQSDAHREPRTLASRRAALLIIEGEHGESEAKLSRAHQNLWDAIGHTSGTFTIFSPWQKRNVPHRVFEQEIEVFYDRVKGANGTGPTGTAPVGRASQ